jgi:hypothetical protein
MNQKPDIKPQAQWTPPTRPLTRKQTAFIKHIVDNPKSTGVEAAQAVYGKPDKPISYRTANAIAVENLQKPAILLELAKHSQTAENTLLDVMNVSREYAKTGDKSGAQYASVAVQTANSILDRLHGKAKQTTEVEQRSVNINIDLSGVAG